MGTRPSPEQLEQGEQDHAAGFHSGTVSNPIDARQVDGCSEETLRECYVQACENARGYVDLRFKHFGTFVVVVGLLAAALQSDTLPTIRPFIAGAALVLTVLFWLLDFRTSQYFKDEVYRAEAYQHDLRTPMVALPRRAVLLRASSATNLIFLTILVTWATLLALFVSP